MVAESLAVWLGLLASATWLARGVSFQVGAAASVLMGLWFQRLYFVGHEAVHGKLWPQDRRWNDRLGQACLVPLVVPIDVYRKIHFFHHAHNRRDHRTSALDTFRVSPRFAWVQKPAAAAAWYFSVFCGGFFVQSLVSVLFFAFVPDKAGRRVTPAYKGWTQRERWRTQLVLAAVAASHCLIWNAFGQNLWLLWCGIPLGVFSLVYSLTTYIFHYRTGYGADTRRNARSLRAGPLVRWWLLDFNFHEAHHREPAMPWYALEEASTLAGEAPSFIKGVLFQFRGPVYVRAGDKEGVA